jgi:cholesterol oxidase
MTAVPPDLAPPESAYDYDWLVIGSGFGGSVSALRLSEKGYSVGVLECGRRFEDHEFAKSTWDGRRYFWNPKLGMKGVLRLSLFKDVYVASGCGVGGGSLGYANTLYVPPTDFFRDPQWRDIDDWETALAPHYKEAQRMLGVVKYEGEGPGDTLLRELGSELGVSETYSTTPVGVFFGEPGVTVDDPYFGGEGPPRTGCVRCGSCMLGCRYGAKNTLVKNYLWFAQRLGASVMAERTVTDIRPAGNPDGSDGFVVTSERSGAWLRKDRRVHLARGVVVAGGALGTNSLLQQCKRRGSLGRLSDRLGYLVRTNSEAILAVTTKTDRHDFTNSLAITSSIYPDAHTHIENVTYGRGADSMSLLFTMLTRKGTRRTRPLYMLLGILRHPLRFARMLWPFKWSRRTVILLVMQTLDNSMRLRLRRDLFGRHRLQTQQDPDHPIPTYIPIANWAAERAAQKLDGIPQSGLTEAMMNIPTTAHILGGAVIGADPSRGVIDARHRAYGYTNLLICDGSSIPANVGVNPSLTITALAERAMEHIPQKDPGGDADRAASQAKSPV